MPVLEAPQNGGQEVHPDEEHQSSEHVDCTYPRLIKQSNLLNGIGFGVINLFYIHRLSSPPSSWNIITLPCMLD